MKIIFFLSLMFCCNVTAMKRGPDDGNELHYMDFEPKKKFKKATDGCYQRKLIDFDPAAGVDDCQDVPTEYPCQNVASGEEPSTKEMSSNYDDYLSNDLNLNLFDLGLDENSEKKNVEEKKLRLIITNTGHASAQSSKKSSKDKPWKCDCGHSFVQKDHLTRHQKEHTGEKPFKCKSCNYKTNRKESLKDHMLIHKSERSFKCDLCSKSFKQNAGLVNHIARIHEKNKSFKCDQCPYRAVFATDLKRHKNKHTGEKPYKCELCNYSAARPDVLKLHVRSAHQGIPHRAKNLKAK